MSKKDRKTKRKKCYCCDYVGTKGKIVGNGYFVCDVCSKKFEPLKIYEEDII